MDAFYASVEERDQTIATDRFHKREKPVANDRPLEGKRVLILVGDVYEDLELWYPKLRLIEAGADVVVAGPEAGKTYAGKHGYPCTSDATIAEIKRVVGDRKAYVTFDIDCLDPVFAPGTGTPVVGGLTTAQALEILRGLGDLDLVGMDIVEVAPAYDHAEVTALAAATLAHDYLCLLAAKKGAGGPSPKE